MVKHYDRTIHSTMIASPYSVTSVLAALATATENHLTARGPNKVRAWRELETRLAEAQGLLKAVI